jgi:hypothetical protein
MTVEDRRRKHSLVQWILLVLLFFHILSKYKVVIHFSTNVQSRSLPAKVGNYRGHVVSVWRLDLNTRRFFSFPLLSFPDFLIFIFGLLPVSDIADEIGLLRTSCHAPRQSHTCDHLPPE